MYVRTWKRLAPVQGVISSTIQRRDYISCGVTLRGKEHYSAVIALYKYSRYRTNAGEKKDKNRPQ